MEKVMIKINNSHGFPKSFSSFASEDFGYKEPWRETGILDGGKDDVRGMMEIKFKQTEKQTQQMRHQQSHE